MLGKIIFQIDSEDLSEAQEERIIAKRLLSYFGDSPGLVGLVEHLNYDAASWRDFALAVTKEFTPEDPRNRSRCGRMLTNPSEISSRR